jgi:hypothetical protein
MQPRVAAGERPRPLSAAALTLYALCLAFGLGFGSAFWSIGRGFPLGALTAGPWVAWPKVGSREADPYAKAVVARRGDIPLGIGEGLTFSASTDSEGRALESACTYRLGRETPAGRFWTLSLYDETGRPAVTELGRASFTSSELLRDAQGRFEVLLSRDALPGNWLRLPAEGRFNLVLRLYDTPVAAGSAALDAAAMPAIERLECRP